MRTLPMVRQAGQRRPEGTLTSGSVSQIGVISLGRLHPGLDDDDPRGRLFYQSWPDRGSCCMTTDPQEGGCHGRLGRKRMANRSQLTRLRALAFGRRASWPAPSV